MKQYLLKAYVSPLMTHTLLVAGVDSGVDTDIDCVSVDGKVVRSETAC